MIEKLQPIKDQANDIVIISKKAFESVEGGFRSGARSEIREIQDKISQLENDIRIENMPKKAFRFSCDGISGFVAAKSCGKARWIVVRSAKEAGYSESAHFPKVKVSRYQKLDEWAKTERDGRTYSGEELL